MVPGKMAHQGPRRPRDLVGERGAVGRRVVAAREGSGPVVVGLLSEPGMRRVGARRLNVAERASAARASVVVVVRCRQGWLRAPQRA